MSDNSAYRRWVSELPAGAGCQSCPVEPGVRAARWSRVSELPGGAGCPSCLLEPELGVKADCLSYLLELTEGAEAGC